MDRTATALAPEPAPVTARAMTFRDVPWRWRDLILGVAPLASIRFLPALVDSPTATALPGWSWVAITLPCLLWMLGYPFLVGRRRVGAIRPVRPRSLWAEVGIALGVALPLVAAMGVLTTLARIYLGPATAANPLESIALAPGRRDLIVLACLAIGVAPVAEEVMFRGLLYNGLRRRLGAGIAAPLVAIAFAWCHPFSLADSLGVGLAGLVFALVYEWRRTLLAPILVHACQNTLAMIMLAASAAALAAGPVLGVVGVPDPEGVRITQVRPASAAAVARLEVGDVVTGLDDVPTRDFATLTQVVRTHQPGDTIRVHFRRDGATIEAWATLKARSESP